MPDTPAVPLPEPGYVIGIGYSESQLLAYGQACAKRWLLSEESRLTPTQLEQRVMAEMDKEAAAAILATLDELAKDAREWGSVLNDCGWEFVSLVPKVTGEQVSGRLFNSAKTITRELILFYIDKHKAKLAAAMEGER